MSIPIEPSMGVSMGSSSHSGWALVLWVVIKSNSKTKEIFNRLFIYLFKILFYKLFKDGLSSNDILKLHQVHSFVKILNVYYIFGRACC